VEVILALLSFKVLYPDHMHLTRGNHETKNMNKVGPREGGRCSAWAWRGCVRNVTVPLLDRTSVALEGGLSLATAAALKHRLVRGSARCTRAVLLTPTCDLCLSMPRPAAFPQTTRPI
jgi:hypothetical protein